MNLMSEIRETNRLETSEYLRIKPETNITKQEANDFWNHARKVDKIDTDDGNHARKIDDEGKTFREGDRLIPNNEFKRNDYVYRTDDQGRVISANGKLRLSENSNRSMESPKNMRDMKDGDERGHLIAKRFGGSDRLENLVPMNAKLNHGDYNSMENKLAKAVQDGHDVRLKVEPVYKEDTMRPSEIRATYTIDGEKDIVSFRNESEATV